MSMMIFGTLFFLGLFVMFVSLLLGQEKVIKTVREEMEQHRMHLALLEQRLALLETEALQGMYASHVSSTSNSAQSVELSLADVAMSGGARATAPSVTSRPAAHPAQAMQQHARNTPPPVGTMQAGQRHQAARQATHTKPVGAKDRDLDLFMAPPHR